MYADLEFCHKYHNGDILTIHKYVDVVELNRLLQGHDNNIKIVIVSKKDNNGWTLYFRSCDLTNFRKNCYKYSVKESDLNEDELEVEYLEDAMDIANFILYGSDSNDEDKGLFHWLTSWIFKSYA